MLSYIIMYTHFALHLNVCVFRSLVWCFNTSFIHYGKFGLPYLGKATAAARAALSIPTRVCSIFLCLTFLRIFTCTQMLYISMRAIPRRGLHECINSTCTESWPLEKISFACYYIHRYYHHRHHSGLVSGSWCCCLHGQGSCWWCLHREGSWWCLHWQGSCWWCLHRQESWWCLHRQKHFSSSELVVVVRRGSAQKQGIALLLPLWSAKGSSQDEALNTFSQLFNSSSSNSS